jgi:F-type H+-transporting ATPase subunit O
VQAPIQLFGVEGRYAHALYSAAVKQKKLTEVEKDLTAFKDVLKKDKTFVTFVMDPTIKRKQKSEALSASLQKLKYSQVTSNFLSEFLFLNLF